MCCGPDTATNDVTTGYIPIVRCDVTVVNIVVRMGT
jgi:hypothetical protein